MAKKGDLGAVLNQLSGELTFAEKLTGKRTAIARQIADGMAGFIAGLLIGNFGAAGLRSRTGTMVKGIGRIKTRLNKTSNGLVWFWPAGLSGYGDKVNFYAVAGALNYGRVIAPRVRVTIAEGAGFTTRASQLTRARVGVRSVRGKELSSIGDKAKRTIKQAALTGKAVSARAGAAIAKAESAFTNLDPARLGQRRTRKSGAIRVAGRYTVVPPRKFDLTEAQKKLIERTFFTRFNAAFAREAKRRAG